MKHLLIFAFLVLLFQSAFAAEHIGNLKKISGDVLVLRASQQIKASAGDQLFEGDMLKTGETGSAGILLKDSTVVSIGPKSEMIINKYLFEPKDSKYAFDMNINKGTAAYSSGRMAKLAPEAIRINTPRAIIGVRGTKLLIQVEE